MKLKKAKRLMGLALLGGLTGNLVAAMEDITIRLPAIEIVVENDDRADPKPIQEEEQRVRAVETVPPGMMPKGLACGVDRTILESCDQVEEYISTMERRQIAFTRESYLSPESLKKQQEERARAKKKKEEEKKKKEKAKRKKKQREKIRKIEKELKKKGYRLYELPEYRGYRGFKSYEPYRAITSRDTPQWKIRMAAKTDEYGLRRINGRICVALGSYFGTKVGQYFDLVLENGTVIRCIMGDEKADRHTDDRYHIYTVHSACCSEFLVDPGILRDYIGSSGDVSKLFRKWRSPVKAVRVYKKNYLRE